MMLRDEMSAEQLIAVFPQIAYAAEENGRLLQLAEALQSFVPKFEGRYCGWRADPSGNIVILGCTAKTRTGDLTGIAKSAGVSGRRLKWILNKDLTNMSVAKYRYDSRTAVILAGPVPHSMRDKGAYTSSLTMMEKEEGYPPVIRLQAAQNGLKITNTSFRSGLMEALENRYVLVG